MKKNTKTGTKIVSFKGKLCSTRKSTKNPDAYTKLELVSLAIKKFKITKTNANKLTKIQICKSLESGKLISKPKPPTPASSPEKSSPIKKKPPTKAKSPIKKKPPTKAKSPTKAKPPIKKKSPAKAKPPIKKKSPAKAKSPKAQSPKAQSPEKAKYPSPQEGNCIDLSSKKLLPHQRKVVEFINQTNRRGLIVDHSMGSGKTLTAATAVICFLQHYSKGKVYVITPVSLIDNFKNAITKDYGIPISKRIHIYAYKKFSNLIKEKEIKCSSDDMIVIDEAHNLRSAFETDFYIEKEDPIISKSILKCSSKVKKVLLLTGTPLYNKSRDIMNLVAFIRGDKTPISLANFNKIYNDTTDKELEKYIKCGISIYKAPRDENYPQEYDHDVYIDMPIPYYNEYMKLENVLLEKKKRKSKNEKKEDIVAKSNAFAILLRTAANKLSSCPKCPTVIDILKGKLYHGKKESKERFPDPQDVEKTIIYSFFRNKGVEILEEELKREGYKYKIISGSVRGSERQIIADEYNSDKVKILLLTKASSEGLDLKQTKNVIIFEQYWNDSLLDQVKSRAIRYKSHNDLPEKDRRVDVYHLILQKPSNKFHKELDTLSNEKLLAYLKDMNRMGVSQVDIDKHKNLISNIFSIKNARECVDVILKAISLLKKLEMNAFEKRLEKLDIEHDASCTDPQMLQQVDDAIRPYLKPLPPSPAPPIPLWNWRDNRNGRNYNVREKSSKIFRIG